MKLRLLSLAVLASIAATPAFAQGEPRGGSTNPNEFRAATTTYRPSAESKEANGITWRCYKNDCVATYGARIELAEQVLSCQHLAQWAGPITSYGRQGHKFTAAQIAQCNTPPPPPPRIVPNVKITPQSNQPKITVPPIKPPG